MTPLAFNVDNAVDLLPDEERKWLTADAIAHAESGKPKRLFSFEGSTYFDHVIQQHRILWWDAAYDKRLARIERIKQRATAQPAVERTRDSTS